MKPSYSAAAAALSLMLAVSVPAAAANGPDPVAAYEAGNYEEALRVFRPRAERGDAQAQYHLGLMYEKGHGVRKDKPLMRQWYERAAQGGHAKAQYKVAVGYAYGLAGLPRSDVDAVKWLRQSAENGYPRAQKMLARAYAEGRLGLPRDPQQAEYWSKKAAG